MRSRDKNKSMQKNGGKEEKTPTMPLMLFMFYRALRSERRGQRFFEDNPTIKLAYEFKEKLCKLLNKKHQTVKQ